MWPFPLCEWGQLSDTATPLIGLKSVIAWLLGVCYLFFLVAIIVEVRFLNKASTYQGFFHVRILVIGVLWEPATFRQCTKSFKMRMLHFYISRCIFILHLVKRYLFMFKSLLLRCCYCALDLWRQRLVW